MAIEPASEIVANASASQFPLLSEGQKLNVALELFLQIQNGSAPIPEPNRGYSDIYPATFAFNTIGGIHAGLGATITPKTTGTIRIAFTGISDYNGVQTQGYTATYIAYGDDSVPVFGAVPKGTPLNQPCRAITNRKVTPAYPYTFYLQLSGLTTGQTYWFDQILINGNAVNTATFSSSVLMVEELN
jgi:hypothetical protein